CGRGNHCARSSEKAYVAAVFRNRRSHPNGLSGVRFYCDLDADELSAVSHKRDLLRRLGRLLSHPLELAALGKFFKRPLAADLRMAAAHGFKSGGLQRPSFPFPPAPDTFSMVPVAGDGRKSIDRYFLYARDIFGLLDPASLQGRLSAYLARGYFDLREYVLLPDEHGKGAAAYDHHHGSWHSPFVPAQLQMAVSADVRVRLDIQPFPAALDRLDNLGWRDSVERTQIRMGTACLYDNRNGDRQRHQPVFSE